MLQDLILPTKKDRNFSVIRHNFLFSVNSNGTFKLCSYKNFTGKMAKILPAKSTKERRFFWFDKKFSGGNFSLVLLMVVFWYA
jgi:hypothetical protein